MTEHPPAPPSPASSLTLHATTVATRGRGLVILGPSGCGKSALALDLIGLGARLVSDDRTLVSCQNGSLVARPPTTLRGLIEARGIGLIPVPCLASARIVAALDLGQQEADRLPPRREVMWLDRPVPMLHSPATGLFASAVFAYLTWGRAA